MAVLIRAAAFLAISYVAFAGEKPKVLVAVAANFKVTCEALGKDFGAKHGAEVAVSSGSTGKLFAQITHGAPFEVFLSADSAHVDKLEAAGAAVAGTRQTYAIGRLALYSARFTANEALLEEGSPVRQLSIANPETAPYGAAAVAVLQGMGGWAAWEGKLVFGENIAQAFQFAETGSADAAFAAYAQVKGLASERYWLVPAERHAPLRQDGVVLQPGKENPLAQRFLDYLREDAARKVISDSGYDLPARAEAGAP